MSLRLAVIGMLLVIGPSAASAQDPGWRELDLGGGARATRYLPFSSRTCDALPLLLFLHGAGGMPENYHSHLEAHAESRGVVMVLPQASGAGWSGADTGTINAALDAVSSELTVDVTRTYIGGHSAGGAWAYILAYGSTGFAAVLSMSAPFYSVGSVRDTTYRAPIHMYYGTDDPNYTGGSATALEMQWTRLGVTFVTDAQPGFGHSTWPPSSIAAGFDFLVAQHYPGTPTASTCGDVDAGASIDASSSIDGGATASDVGVLAGDGGATDGGSLVDAATGRDGSGRGGVIASGCGCRAGGRSAPGLGLSLLLALALIRAGRDRARPRSRSRSTGGR